MFLKRPPAAIAMMMYNTLVNVFRENEFQLTVLPRSIATMLNANTSGFKNIVHKRHTNLSNDPPKLEDWIIFLFSFI